jgi:hypothetical protein
MDRATFFQELTRAAYWRQSAKGYWKGGGRTKCLDFSRRLVLNARRIRLGEV